MASTKEKLIAKKYASALAELKLAKEIIEDLSLIKEIFSSSPELQTALSNPSIKSENKKAVLESVFSKKIQKETMDCLALLLKKRRVELAPFLLEFYREAFYSKENIDLAEVQSAQQLSSTELAEIKEALEKSFKKNIEINNTADSSLIAGMKIKIANKVIDSSLKTKLKQIKSLLLK